MNRVGRCEVVVIGAGLAGLVAADHLHRLGADVQVLEAGPRVGGRVRGEPADSGVLDTGAEFVGRPHRRLRALIDSLGLHTEPTGLDRSPILWRTPDHSHAGYLPPLPLRELAQLAAALWRLRRQALTLDPDHPWTSRATAELDTVSIADWLARHGVGRAGIEVADAVIGGFATRPIQQVSAAHAAWWIASAGGLLAALQSGQQLHVHDGAHQIPQRLARRLGARIHLNTPGILLTEHHDGVEVQTDDHTWTAAAAIVAVPLPALRHLIFDPPLPPPARSAIENLAYGHAVKISATTHKVSSTRHRAVAGGPRLTVAWRTGHTLAGIATTHHDLTTEELTTDLCDAFALTPSDLTGIAVTDWNRDPHIGGSYLIYQPHQLLHHAPHLHTAHQPRIRFASSDLSAWPNSMQGAVHTGHTTATTLHRKDP